MNYKAINKLDFNGLLNQEGGMKDLSITDEIVITNEHFGKISV